MKLFIRPDGTCVCINDDNVVPQLLDYVNGEARITRASHVEPTSELSEAALDWLTTHEIDHSSPICWWADMIPSGGPVLGPFRTRTEALHAEYIWLLEHLRNGK